MGTYCEQWMVRCLSSRSPLFVSVHSSVSELAGKRLLKTTLLLNVESLLGFSSTSWIIAISSFPSNATSLTSKVGAGIAVKEVDLREREVSVLHSRVDIAEGPNLNQQTWSCREGLTFQQ